MRATIEKIVYPGKSLAFVESKALFTDEGLPGETVEVEIRKRKDRYSEGITRSILKPSSHRTEPQCRHYKICSAYQYIEYPFQLEIKKQQLQELFSHQLKMDPVAITIQPSPLIWGWRNKINLQVCWEKGRAAWAYHVPKNNEALVPVSHCALVPPVMNSCLDKLIALINSHKFTDIREIVLRYSFSDNALLLALYPDIRNKSKIFHQAFSSLASGSPLKGILIVDSENNEQLLFGKSDIRENIRGIKFSIGAGSFFQINCRVLEKTLEDLHNALKLTGKEIIADLYCGVGTIGLFLAKEAGQVIAVEPDPENTRFLEKNIRENKMNNVVVMPMKAENWTGGKKIQTPDILIVDPPRRGLQQTVCSKILKDPAGRLCYLSCDPSTLMRDLKILLSKYLLRQVFAYDFFPQTPHIETLVILEKR